MNSARGIMSRNSIVIGSWLTIVQFFSMKNIREQQTAIPDKECSLVEIMGDGVGGKKRKEKYYLTFT